MVFLRVLENSLSGKTRDLYEIDHLVICAKWSFLCYMMVTLKKCKKRVENISLFQKVRLPLGDFCNIR